MKTRNNLKTETKRNHPNWAESFRLTTLGWELVLPIFCGVLIGYLIDQHFFSSGYRFTLTLLILGIFFGYYNLYRVIELDLLRNKAAKLRKKFKEESKK